MNDALQDNRPSSKGRVFSKEERARARRSKAGEMAVQPNRNAEQRIALQSAET
jgi:hypothetical protein